MDTISPDTIHSWYIYVHLDPKCRQIDLSVWVCEFTEIPLLQSCGIWRNMGLTQHSLRTVVIFHWNHDWTMIQTHDSGPIAVTPKAEIMTSWEDSHTQMRRMYGLFTVHMKGETWPHEQGEMSFEHSQWVTKPTFLVTSAEVVIGGPKSVIQLKGHFPDFCLLHRLNWLKPSERYTSLAEQLILDSIAFLYI